MPDLPFNFDRALAGIAKVTLRGGVVGKVAFSIVVVSIALAVIAWSANNVWVSGAAITAVFILAFVMLWRLIDFADRHPQAALLEGAEFLLHEQIVHASKSSAFFPPSETIQTQPPPIAESAADMELAKLPDQDLTAIDGAEGGH